MFYRTTSFAVFSNNVTLYSLDLHTASYRNRSPSQLGYTSAGDCEQWVRYQYVKANSKHLMLH